jgi:hypothetical protein
MPVEPGIEEGMKEEEWTIKRNRPRWWCKIKYSQKGEGREQSSARFPGKRKSTVATHDPSN